MSRIGKLPITIPENVDINYKNSELTIKGKFGTLTTEIPNLIDIVQENNKKYLLISLKYIGQLRKPVISKIKRVSKPGLRIYANSKELPRVLENLGIAIISTSKGVMTNLNAKKLGIGGEVLCYIW